MMFLVAVLVVILIGITLYGVVNTKNQLPRRVQVEEFEAKFYMGDVRIGKSERKKYQDGGEKLMVVIRKNESRFEGSLDVLLNGNPIGTASEVVNKRGMAVFSFVLDSRNGQQVPVVMAGDELTVTNGIRTVTGKYRLD